MSTTREKERDRPEIVALPPVLYLGTLAIGLVIHLIRPVHLFRPSVAMIVGSLLAFIAVSLAIWAETVMRRAGTNVIPTKPTLAIVTGGPFRFTRNPLYVASTLLYISISVFLNALWPLVLLPALLVVIHRGVIKREEKYLEGKFGETYLNYKARVRRWL